MFTNTPSDRMQFRGLGELPQPATCMVCGSGTYEEGYVDLGVWYDYVGNMLLCGTCLVQAAELIGCLTPGETETLKELASRAAAEADKYHTELNNALERLAIYDALFGDLVSSGALSANLDLEDANEVDGQERNNGLTLVRGSASGESDVEESPDLRSAESAGDSEPDVLIGKSPESKREVSFDI